MTLTIIEISTHCRNICFTEIMILAACSNIIFMHIQKDINLGRDLIKIKLLWRGRASEVNCSFISHHYSLFVSVITDSAITEVTLFITWLLNICLSDKRRLFGRKKKKKKKNCLFVQFEDWRLPQWPPLHELR